ncbi:MAG: hypothetical protein MPW14_22205 [Candidatus Manganitrophus sp.]|nr:MAG: hypothetical protein MPW14_22205 [Candidatus Manganitrophus sp.]
MKEVHTLISINIGGEKFRKKAEAVEKAEAVRLDNLPLGREPGCGCRSRIAI